MSKDDEQLTLVHPGEILKAEFLLPMAISMNRLALETGIPHSRISAIVRGARSITGDTALRLGRFFGLDPQVWMNLQSDYDLRVARRELGERLEREVRPLHRAS